MTATIVAPAHAPGLFPARAVRHGPAAAPLRQLAAARLMELTSVDVPLPWPDDLPQPSEPPSTIGRRTIGMLAETAATGRHPSLVDLSDVTRAERATLHNLEAVVRRAVNMQVARFDVSPTRILALHVDAPQYLNSVWSGSQHRRQLGPVIAAARLFELVPSPLTDEPPPDRPFATLLAVPHWFEPPDNHRAVKLWDLSSSDVAGKLAVASNDDRELFVRQLAAGGLAPSIRGPVAVIGGQHVPLSDLWDAVSSTSLRR